MQILGINEIYGEKIFVLQFLQGRNPEWVRRPFFAKYDEKAMWFDDLEPAFGEKKFFFEKSTDDLLISYKDLQRDLFEESFSYT